MRVGPSEGRVNGEEVDPQKEPLFFYFEAMIVSRAVTSQPIELLRCHLLDSDLVIVVAYEVPVIKIRIHQEMFGD
jgi:hypothetical protein